MAKDVFGSADSIGEVQIANDVIAAIAGISASEVEGIESMVGNSIDDIVSLIGGGKNQAKGVKLSVSGNKTIIDIAVNMRFGYSIPKISAKVQDKVTQAVYNMTGLEVTKVNVKVAGIAASD